MSTILNLTDGLLGDGLKLKFICTFNTDINQIDDLNNEISNLYIGSIKAKLQILKKIGN